MLRRCYSHPTGMFGDRIAAHLLDQPSDGPVPATRRHPLRSPEGAPQFAVRRSDHAIDALPLQVLHVLIGAFMNMGSTPERRVPRLRHRQRVGVGNR